MDDDSELPEAIIPTHPLTLPGKLHESLIQHSDH